MNHLLAFRIRLHIGQVFRQGFAGDGQAIAVQQALVQQRFHQRLDAADFDQFGHQVFAAGFQVGQHRHMFADAGEVVEGKIHAGRIGHRQQVQHRIGRAAERNDDGDGVLECGFGHDVAGLDVFFQQFQYGSAGAFAIQAFVVGNGGLGGAVGQAHAQRFDGGGHGVGGVHAAAGTRARNGFGFDFGQFGIVDLVVGAGADRFEDGNDVQFFVFVAAGHNRAAVNKHRRTVQSRHGHHAAGHVFVAAADRDDAVEALATDHGFNRVGNHFAGHQRIFHAFGAHRNAVGNRDGVEDHGFAVGIVDADAAASASLSMCMLHGVTMLQVEAMPICGFLKSSLLKPTACSMARLGARSMPSTT